MGGTGTLVRTETGGGDEDERLRLADAEDRDDQTRAEADGPGGAPSLLARTVTGTTYPTTTGVMFKMEVVGVTGSETEGATATTTNTGTNFFALGLGTNVPASGTKVVCNFVTHRWVFQYDGP